MKLKHDELLSNSAFNFNLRRYNGEVAAEINAAAHIIRQSHGSGAYLANCFVRHLGNCIVPAACNLHDLAVAAYTRPLLSST